MKVFLNKNELNLAFVEYDLVNACVNPESNIRALCVNHGMEKSQLVTQLRSVANFLEHQSNDIIILQ